jgi:His-Xaa-Ser system protein HxsD
MKGIHREGENHLLSFDTEIYGLEAIKKSAYKFADRASIILQSQDPKKITVVFNFVGHHSKSDPELVIADFCNEVLDQDLREIIKAETAPVRNLILAHAFSHTKLVNES